METKNLLNKKITQWLLLVAMLVGCSANVLAFDVSGTVYFDNTNTKFSSCYLYIGKSDYTSCYAMERVSGTQYLYKLEKSWGGASMWYICSEKWWDSANENVYKYSYHTNKSCTYKYEAKWTSGTYFKASTTTQKATDYSQNMDAYTYSTTNGSLSNYTVTISNGTGGTTTVKDYDNTPVSSGASKIYLTVLKITVSPDDGYAIKSVKVGATDYTTQAEEGTFNVTLTANTTITTTFESTCPAVSQASISGDATMYVGDNKTYTASATGGTITSYAWTVPSGLSGTSSSSTISITATGSGSPTLKAKATNDCGNTGADGSKSITVSALPSVTNQNATAVSNSQINLTWKHNANKTTVMVVRYLSSASITDPTQGQEYNTTDKKTIGAGTVIYKGTDESFQSTGLTAATSYTYYFYTVNNNYYSSGVNFNATTHSACVPPTSVTTADASNIKSTSATLGGSYSGGSGIPTEVGIEWVSGKSGQETASMGSSFSVNVTGLSAGTTYTYKAYAKACETTVYGDVKTLTTCAVPVMAQATRNNDYGSDYLKFNVKASSLGCTVTEWGVNVYSNSGCTSLVKSVQGAGSLSTSSQVVNVTGLTSNTNYWVKSYAKYDDGDKMVEASTATRWQPKVVLGETSSSSVTSNSATLSSSTLLGGGAKTSMTALFRYSTSEGSIASGATIASSQTQVGQTISANLTGLTSGTTYYYRVEVTYTDDKGNVSLIGETNSFTTLNVHGAITGLPASPLAKCSADEPLQLAPQCSTATSWAYSSSNTSAATVSNSGLITIKGAGSTTITVTAKATGYADKQAQFTINVAANPTLTLSGSGAKSASATYPWEYMTITATCSVTPTWDLTGKPAGFTEDVDYVVEGSDKVYKIKAKQTNNEDTDKFTFTVTATADNGCSTVMPFDVYINAAPAEDCGK